MKVFLSSTYDDLIEHRKAAHDALERLGLHVIWMEAFGARPQESTKACLKEIEGCDLFVGIYAHRYGYIPLDSDISITEQEFLHAQSKGKPIFGFIVHEDHPWSPKMVEHNKKDQLEAFLKKVKTQPVKFFDIPENLASNIASSVGHHLAKRIPFPDSQPPIYEPPKPHGSTLPNQPYFFGRVKELATIADAISLESRTWGALIDGPGGIGKTALAIKAATDAPNELFERKIFITAKVRELRPEGERPLTDFTRADYLSMLNELALELGEEGIPRLAPAERTNALRMALANQKTLIIFDNLETLHEDERIRLFQFLGRLPLGNKAIITSRRRADIDARIVRVDRLQADEALDLMAELARNNRRLARASETERHALYEMTYGNPLLIKWVCGQLGQEHSHYHTIAEACALLKKAPKDNDPLEYIFGDLLETVSENETRALAALSHFDAPAKLEWISEMSGLPQRAAETTLEDLADRSILIAMTEARTFFLPPLTAQFIKTRRPEAVRATGNTLADHTYILVMQYGGEDNYEGFKILEAEWQVIAASLPHLLQSENSRLQSVCDSLYQFLNFSGRWDESIRFNLQTEEKAIAAGDHYNAGWRAYQTGWVYSLCNQPAEVLICAARAETHWKNAGVREKASAIQLRGLGHKLKKNGPAAINAYREVLDLDRTNDPESRDVAITLNDLAEAERAAKDYIAAERDYREALRIAKKLDYKEGIAYITGNLAGLALNRKEWLAAEFLALEALALAEGIGRLQLITNYCHRLATAITHQQRPAEALPYARRAVKMYIHLHMKEELEDAQKLLAEIEKAISESGD